MKTARVYRFNNGTRLYTGANPSAVPFWTPTQCSVPMTRAQAARELWKHRRICRRVGGLNP